MLVVVFAANTNPQLTGAALMSHQVSAVFIGAAVMNLLALFLTAIFILPANRENERPCSAATLAGPAE